MNLLFDYASLGILFLVLLILVYGMIVIHDIPYEIAKKRNHPHQEAIHVAGWVSLFFMHAIWPFLWIWSMLYDPKKEGWAGTQAQHADDPAIENRIAKLELSLSRLEKSIDCKKMEK